MMEQCGVEHAFRRKVFSTQFALWSNHMQSIQGKQGKAKILSKHLSVTKRRNEFY
jgi:hypothetical protein